MIETMRSVLYTLNGIEMKGEMMIGSISKVIPEEFRNYKPSDTDGITIQVMPSGSLAYNGKPLDNRDIALLSNENRDRLEQGKTMAITMMRAINVSLNGEDIRLIIIDNKITHCVNSTLHSGDNLCMAKF